MNLNRIFLVLIKFQQKQYGLVKLFILGYLINEIEIDQQLMAAVLVVE